MIEGALILNPGGLDEDALRRESEEYPAFASEIRRKLELRPEKERRRRRRTRGTDPLLAIALSIDPSAAIRGLVAQNDTLPSYALRFLARDPSPFVLCQLLARMDLPIDAYDIIISRIADNRVLMALAGHEGIPFWKLETMIEVGFPLSLLAIMNKSVPNKTRWERIRIADDPENHPHCVVIPTDFIERGKETFDANKQAVQYYADIQARAKAMSPTELLHFLISMDEDRCLAELAVSDDEKGRAKAAEFSRSHGIVGRLSHDASEFVRCAVARNRSAPRSVLTRLAFDPSKQVVKTVAKNDRLEKWALMVLAWQADKGIRQAVSRNFATTEDVRKMIGACSLLPRCNAPVPPWLL